MAQLATLLNIVLETLAFVDDQVFEREEVMAALPQVIAIDSADYLNVAARAECSGPVTTESKNRRVMYRAQEQRQTALESYEGRYTEFLRNCQMTMGIGPLDEANLTRVYELAQRTNQLNFSGSRYLEAQLVEIMR